MSEDIVLPPEIKAIFTDAANFYAETQVGSVSRMISIFEKALLEGSPIALPDEVHEALGLIKSEARDLEVAFRDLMFLKLRYMVKGIRDLKTIEELKGVIALVKHDDEQVISAHGARVMMCEAFLAEAERVNEECPELNLLRDPEDD